VVGGRGRMRVGGGLQGVVGWDGWVGFAASVGGETRCRDFGVWWGGLAGVGGRSPTREG